MIHGGFPNIAHDLSICLNPLGPPPAVLEWWEKPAAVWMRYPEAHAESARAALASHLQITMEHLLLGNGCGELFALALRALEIPSAVTIRPCYGGYHESTALANVPFHTLDLPQSLWGAPQLSLPDLESALQKIVLALGTEFRGALFLANPNNPDGRLLPWQTLCRLADLIPQGWVFLDQSYMDFIELPSEHLGYRALPHELPANMLIFQSFTKFFCLAGTRLAGVWGAPHSIARLRHLQLPWSVNGPAQEIAKLLYNDTTWLQASRSCWKNTLKTLQQEWNAYGIQPCSRHAPWLFAHLTPQQSSHHFLHHCLSTGKAVRIFQDGPAGIENYVRIGLPLENHAC